MQHIRLQLPGRCVLPLEFRQLARLRNSRQHVEDKARLSKQLARKVRDFCRQRRKESMQCMIENVRGIQSLSQWQRHPKQRQHILSVCAQCGELVTARADVLEVFAEFYTSLYNADLGSCVQPQCLGPAGSVGEAVLPEEVQAALAKLKPKRTC